jgi:flagellar biosynthesis/type III secretory pathway chaperone
MTIESLLTLELELVRKFIDCLVKEQAVLSKDKVHDLQSITDCKNQLLGEMIDLTDQRNALLRQAGFPDNVDGLKTWLALNASPSNKSVFDSLRSLSAQAKMLNESNASLVNSRLQATQQALSILLPQEQAPSLYNLQGQSSQRSGFKLIDSA